MAEFVCAVVVTHQRHDELAKSLIAVTGQSRPLDHLIVVDNDDDDQVRDLVTNQQVPATYLGSRRNLGGAGGFALGILHALALGADWVWCADDDGRPQDSNVLATLLACAEKHGLAEVSPMVCDLDDPARLAFPLRQGLMWRRSVSELHDRLPGQDLLPGIASLFNGALFRAATLEAVGVPDLRLFVRGDETEVHRRLVRSGLPFGTCLDAVYLHPCGTEEFKPILGGRMHSQYPDDATKRFFTYRNRGYLLAQPGLRPLLFQEWLRFGWLFLVTRRDPAGLLEWIRLRRLGRRERFGRPGGDPPGDDSVHAVLVTHRRIDMLSKALDVMTTQTHALDHVVVVDNDDDERIRDLVAGQPIPSTYIGSRRNLGGAGGFALGMLHALAAGADWVWCSDDDGCPQDRTVLATLMDCAEKHQLAAVSPLVCNIDDPRRLAFPSRPGLVLRRYASELRAKGPRQDLLPGQMSLFNGALFSAVTLEKIGVPDLRLFVRGDEMEMYRRLGRARLPFGTSLDATYLHPDGSFETIPIFRGMMHAQHPDDPIKRFYLYRNRGYLEAQPGLRRTLPREWVRFVWFFLVFRRDPAGLREWMRVHKLGRREMFAEKP